MSLWYIAFFFLDLDCFWLILYAKAQPVALPDFLKKKTKANTKNDIEGDAKPIIVYFLIVVVVIVVVVFSDVNLIVATSSCQL